MKTSRVSLEIVLKEINFILDNIYPSSKFLFENNPLIQRATVLRDTPFT